LSTSERKKIINSPQEFRREVERSIGDAEDAATIARRLINPPYLVAKHVAADEVATTELVQKFCDEYAPYKRIQEVLSSILIRPVRGERWVLYDPDTHRMTPCNENILKADFNRKEDYLRNSRNVLLTYNPKNPNRLYKTEGMDLFNIYQPPFWKKENFYKGTAIPFIAEVPDLYKRFLNHLCNENQESVDFILDWLAISLQSRNKTYLCTIGDMGIGKGILAKIMFAIHGKPNCTNIAFKSISKQFNSTFYGKTLIYLDEVNKVSSEQNDMLKKQNDDEIEIEKKNVDSEVVENYSNIYISSNHLDSLRIEPGDRRYSIVSLTDKRLEHVFNETEINALTEDKTLVENFAYYLYHRPYNRKNITFAFKSSRALEIMNATALDWEKWFIDEFCKDNEGSTIKAKDIVEFARGEFTKSNITISALESLASRFSGIFKITKRSAYKEINVAGNIVMSKDEKRVFCVEINKLDKQAKYDIIETEDKN
jgi:hypothetical protein